MPSSHHVGLGETVRRADRGSDQRARPRTTPRDSTEQPGVALWERGYIDRALDDLAQAIRLDTQAAIPLMNRGDLLRQLERFEEALQDYSTAIQIEPDNQYFRRSRAGLLHRLGQFAEAIADYDVAIEIEPESQRTRDLRERAQTQVEPD